MLHVADYTAILKKSKAFVNVFNALQIERFDVIMRFLTISMLNSNRGLLTKEKV